MPTKKKLLSEVRETERNSESGREPGQGMAEEDVSWAL